ncbi:MAG TPA: NADH-quinone oxidoreductase subunit NuoB [Thermoplasmata archaeon]|nr:NADH-quinone oxidoreductase subunit NuoB [Thermoplasmata archaeon]
MTEPPFEPATLGARRPAPRALLAGASTIRYPLGSLGAWDGPPRTPVHSAGRCEGTGTCARACPTGAIEVDREPGTSTVRLDYGKCLFCGLCVDACPSGAMTSVPFEEMAVTRRSDLVLQHGPGAGPTAPIDMAQEVRERVQRLYGTSLAIRAVDAGSCNGCEVEVAALLWPRYDMERLGIHLVASPRHADALLVTGPVTRNMRLALEKTYRSVPGPSFVVAVGACGISGGPFFGSPEVEGGVDRVLPVEVYVPGCPPSPISLLYGLWLALGKVDQRVTCGELPSPADRPADHARN